MTHIYRGRFGSKYRPPKHECAAAVYDASSHLFSQCTRKAVVCREVDGEEWGFCRQHDPVAVEARRQERKRKWREERAAQRAAIARRDRIAEAEKACVEAIRAIAAGHNDPRALAVEALALFPGA